MDAFEPTSSTQETSAKAAPTADPSIAPTPDYGSLGPGSDAATYGLAPRTSSKSLHVGAFAPAIAVLLGVFLASLVAGFARSRGPLSSALHHEPLNQSAGASDLSRLDQMKPQRQAETLLELAVGQSGPGVDQISSRLDRWQGKLQWNSQIATLTSAALNSNDMRVRQSGVEIELAAYGLGKNSSSLDYVLHTVQSRDHERKIWALWALGLMGNRGVQTDRVLQALTSHLHDSDEDSRRWTVEALALTGTSEAVPLLLSTMHDDPSLSVRERAACGLAKSGLFTPQQRFSAVPQLVNYTDDPALNSETHAWAFQALTEITGQSLPNDAAAWHSWYDESMGQRSRASN